MIKAKRVGEKGSGTGIYQGSMTYGGKTSNDYDWACAVCGKVYSFRWAANQCCEEAKK